jgi:membrane protein YdbS with pleckstrin-like domain
MTKAENIPEVSGAASTLIGSVLAGVAAIQAIAENASQETKWTAMSAIAVTVAGLIINIVTLVIRSRREAQKEDREAEFKAQQMIIQQQRDIIATLSTQVRPPANGNGNGGAKP